VRDKYPPDHPKQHQVWYYHHFHFTAPPTTPDTWAHRVSAGSSDAGRSYQYSFQPLETVELMHEMGVGLQALLPNSSRTPLRPCVVCYVTRDTAKNLELLVFTGHPWGGVQVIAGGIDAGETPLEAAGRELLEESGLNLEASTYLGRHDYFVRLERLEASEARYCYHFHVSHELPDAWVHTVSSGEADKGLEYQFYWERVNDAKLDWELGEFLPLLEERENHD
jgi:8-oxo-dGTP diphosphatase